MDVPNPEDEDVELCLVMKILCFLGCTVLGFNTCEEIQTHLHTDLFQLKIRKLWAFAQLFIDVQFHRFQTLLTFPSK